MPASTRVRRGYRFQASSPWYRRTRRERRLELSRWRESSVGRSVSDVPKGPPEIGRPERNPEPVEVVRRSSDAFVGQVDFGVVRRVRDASIRGDQSKVAHTAAAEARSREGPVGGRAPFGSPSASSPGQRPPGDSLSGQDDEITHEDENGRPDNHSRPVER